MFMELKKQFLYIFKKQKQRDKTRDYIFSYFVVILICTTVMTTLVYNYINNETEKNVIYSNNSTLMNFKNTIDNFVLKNIDSIGLSILSDKDIFIDFFTTPFAGNSSSMIDLYDKLKTLASFNPIITEISVYYKNSNVIISTKGINYLTDTSSQMAHRDVEWVDYMDSMKNLYEWMETRKTRGKESYPYYSINTISLVRKYPFSYKDYLGGIVISIDESKLQSLIKDAAPENIRQIIIVNENGTIISHNDQNLISTPLSALPYGQKLIDNNDKNGYFITWYNGKKMVVSYAASEYNKWKYISVNYIDQLSENYKFLNLVSLYFGLSIIIIFIIALFLSVRRITKAYSEVKDLSSIVRKQEGEILKNRNVVLQNFYLNLINGIYQKTDEILNQLDLLKINFSFPFYMVVVIKLIGENATDLRTSEYTKLKIINFAEEVFEDNGINCLCTQSKKSVILVLNIRNKEENCKEIIRKICGYIFNELNFQACAGLSDICDELLKISELYNQSLTCINYCYLLHDKYILTCNDIMPLEESKNRIPDTYLEKFYSSLRTRNKEESILCVHELVTDISQGAYPFNHTMAVLMQIIALLENYKKQLPLDNSIDNEYTNLYYNLDCCESITDFTILIENVLDSWFADDSSSSSVRNKELIEKVKLYISSNIAHELISLNTIADVMHISPNYLSRIFKEETSMYFIDYLIEARLEMSKDLLLCSDMSIESIAEAAGYNSLLYYNRKFKSRYGKTPKQYRTENA